MKSINGKTRVCGLIGNPVEHTLSPVIHNTLSGLQGINLAYVPFEVKKGGLEAAVRGAYELNVAGLNVTVPYKSDVIPYLAEVDELAKKIGAVNTLVRCSGGYKGYNTDVPGLKRALESDGLELYDRSVIILGAGGAARAVAFLCAASGCRSIYILNRSVEKADAIAKETGRAFGGVDIFPMDIKDYKNIPGEDRLVIQATSVGLSPHEDECVTDDEDFYRKASAGYDLIYRPFETRFMKNMKAQGRPAFNGLKLLLFQAVIAYELWNNCSVDSETVDRVYEVLKKEFM